MKYDVSGLGNPLIDILVHVNNEFLEKYNLNKGIMHLIEKKEKDSLIDALNTGDYKIEVGGSSPNTITTLAKLGLKTALAGMVGNDKLGELFIDKLKERGIESYLKKNDTDTGTSIVLITPDGERTMNTYLGASRFFSPDDLEEKMIEESRYFYFTGYMWDTDNQKESVKKAIHISKKSRTEVIFDLADPFAVDRYRDEFLELLKNDISIVLANAEEARILTGEKPDKSVKILGEMCRIAVVKNGEKDTFISENKKVYRVKSFTTKVVDTTGAGDNFAAGFIFGLINGFDIEFTGKLASFVAMKTIEKVGAQAPEDIISLLSNYFNKNF